MGNLLGFRSGVYHPAANHGDDAKHIPERGSKTPGSWFVDNNWDSNALGTIFERQTHEALYDAFDAELAQPLGMEDFVRADQQPERKDDVSLHPANYMFLSARDMARLGLLMLRRGTWGGKELIPRDWVSAMLTPTATAEQAHDYVHDMGYGKGWWLFDNPQAHEGGPFHGAYTAAGTSGQYITVVPSLDLVVVHKVLHRSDESLGTKGYRRLLDLIAASRM